MSQMGLCDESKAVSTLGVRTADEEDGKELGAEDQACYRSWTMRASHLGQDWCELQFAVKELARRMQQPNTKNMQALKRLVRFLKGSPRCLVVYNRQAEQPIVDVFSDSDWTGCAKTRRATSSSYVMLGGHFLAASAATQNVVGGRGGRGRREKRHARQRMHRIMVAEHLGDSRRPRHPRALDDSQVRTIEG